MRVRNLSSGSVVNVSDSKAERLLSNATQWEPAGGSGQGDFDPSGHTVAEVQKYLVSADETETKRVLDAERSGKNRASLVGDD